jgi:hypothetical protein
VAIRAPAAVAMTRTDTKRGELPRRWFVLAGLSLSKRLLGGFFMISMLVRSANLASVARYLVHVYVLVGTCARARTYIHVYVHVYSVPWYQMVRTRVRTVVRKGMYTCTEDGSVCVRCSDRAAASAEEYRVSIRQCRP